MVASGGFGGAGSGAGFAVSRGATTFAFAGGGNCGATEAAAFGAGDPGFGSIAGRRGFFAGGLAATLRAAAGFLTGAFARTALPAFFAGAARGFLALFLAVALTAFFLTGEIFADDFFAVLFAPFTADLRVILFAIGPPDQQQELNSGKSILWVNMPNPG